MANEEFRTAITAFLRSWGVVDWVAQNGEEEVERMIDVVVNEDGPISQLFRRFHAEHGRYPEFSEICPPGGPVTSLGILPDIK